MWTRYKLQSEGARTEGTILEVGPAKDSSGYHLRIEVRFEDGKTVEFQQDVPNHFDLDVPSVRGLPLNGVFAPPPTVIPVSFDTGDRVPVRYEPDRRRKFVVDVIAIRLRVVPEWKATPAGSEWRRQYDPAWTDVDAATDAAATTGTDATIDADALAKLAELHRLGDLSDEEFAASKRKLLGV